MSGHPPPLRVLVVDDEDLARVRLRSLVADCPLPAATVVGEAANATQTLAWLAAGECDVVLLDIRMPGRDGLQLAAELNRRDPVPAVVFVTAHADHALEAFDLHAVDYLTKPVRRERLQAALQRAALRLAQQRAASSASGADAVIVVSELGRHSGSCGKCRSRQSRGTADAKAPGASHPWAERVMYQHRISSQCSRLGGFRRSCG